MSRLKLLTVVYLIGFSFGLNAQIQNFEWVKTLQSTSAVVISNFNFDSNKNIILAGGFFDTTDFNPGSSKVLLINQSANIHGYVAKYTPQGNLIWAKEIKGNRTNVYDFKIDSQDKIHILGSFIDSADFDPSSNVNMHYGDSAKQNLFLLTLDNNGNFDNVKVYKAKTGGTSVQYIIPKNVYLDNGNFYILCDFKGELVLDSATNLTVSALHSQMWRASALIFKLDRNKNFLWHKKIDKESFDFEGFTTDGNGNSYIAQNFNDILIADSSFSTVPLGIRNNWNHTLIGKLDPFGNFVWIKSLNAHTNHSYSFLNFRSLVTDTDIDDQGNIFLTGELYDTIDVNPDPNILTKRFVSTNDGAIFIIKLDNNGNYLWDKLYHSSSIGIFRPRLTLTNNSRMVLNCNFTGSIDIDPSANIVNVRSNSNSQAFFSSVLDSNGFYLSHKLYSGLSFAQASKVDFYDNALYTTGRIDGPTAFDPPYNSNIQPATYWDAFILKTVICENVYDTLNIYHCANYTLPSGKAVLTTSGQYFDTIPGALDCDSILTINLTIGSVDTSFTVNGAQIQANAQGKNYQWLDCNNGYSPLSGEINRNFIATATGNYAVEITDGNCIDTTSCIPIIVTGISEANFSSNLNVFPNPTTSATSIYFEETQKSISYTVRSVSGKLIEKGTTSNVKRIPLALNCANGVYFATVVNDNNESAVVKIIKN